VTPNKVLDVVHGGKKWCCDGCGKWDWWGATWQWHGSLGDAEDGNWNRVTVVCSQSCKNVVKVLR